MKGPEFGAGPDLIRCRLMGFVESFRFSFLHCTTEINNGTTSPLAVYAAGQAGILYIS